MTGIPTGGPIDPEQHMVVVRTAAAWAAQARAGMDAIAEAAGGQPPASFAACASIAPAAFASVVEALVALEPYTGRPVGQDLIDLAGLKPVDQALMEGN